MANVKPGFTEIGQRAQSLVSDCIVFNQPRNIITLHPFTITAGGTSSCAITSVGGRPCVVSTGAGASATDRTNFSYGVAGHILQQGKKCRIYGSFYGVAPTTQEFFFGLSSNVTGFLATPGTDFIGLRKLTTVAQPSVVARKASGTAQDTVIPLPGGAITAATWMDFELVVKSDPTTAGQGKVDVYYGESIAAGAAIPLIAADVPIATQFPDTVKMGLLFALGSGGTDADLGYCGHIGFEILG